MLVHVADFTPEEVLPFIIPKPMKGQVKDRVYAGFRVAMDSLRYQVFAKSLACEKCGIVGNVMRLQYNDADKMRSPDRAHFNLYCVREGQEDVLMTKDHIVPSSLGGNDRISNLRNYCGPCNWERGNGKVNHFGTQPKKGFRAM